jgi:hypothetical protein
VLAVAGRTGSDGTVPALQFTFTDLVYAWSDRRRGEDGADERYARLRDAFGVDLDRPPAGAPVPAWANGRTVERREGRFTYNGWEPGWPARMHRLAVETDDALRTLRNPLDGVDLDSAAMTAVAGRFGSDVAGAVALARRQAMLLLIDLLATLYPDAAEQIVTLEVQ